MSNKSYKDIPGWFNWENLYDEIVAELDNGSRIVEVGSWMGQSVIYLAQQVAISKKDIKINAVDIWDMSYDYEPFHSMFEKAKSLNTDLYGLFTLNLETFNVSNLVNPLMMNSVTASEEFEKETVDVVFIDANHSYEAVRDDLRAWWPKIKKGGIMTGHDYFNPPPDGVKQAVDEFFQLLDLSVQIKEGCWYVRHA